MLHNRGREKAEGSTDVVRLRANVAHLFISGNADGWRAQKSMSDLADVKVEGLRRRLLTKTQRKTFSQSFCARMAGLHFSSMRCYCTTCKQRRRSSHTQPYFTCVQFWCLSVSKFRDPWSLAPIIEMTVLSNHVAAAALGPRYPDLSGRYSFLFFTTFCL